MSEYKVRRGFSEYNIEVLKEYGLTPEEARDEVVERLKECNLNAADLAKFKRPIDELAFSDVQLRQHRTEKNNAMNAEIW